MDKTLLFLEQIKYNLGYVDYDMIYNAIAEMPDKAVPTKIIKKGTLIDRVRINDDDNIFWSIIDISYISKPELIELIKFGRANKEKQPIFYGAKESTEIFHQRVVAYVETSKIQPIKVQFDNLEEIFTVSRWRVKEDFEVVEMVFSNDAINASIDVKNEYEAQLINLIDETMREHHISQLRLFSDEFAKVDICSNADYKISAAYINYIWDRTDYKGVLYPSVRTLYKGQNIALKPEFVDKFLDLELVGMFKFKRENKVDLPIEEAFKIATDFGQDNMCFCWKDIKK